MTEQFGSGFEGLEERTLLAANVTAVLSNGTLTITGATSGADVADFIEVYGDGTTGHVTIDVNGGTLAGDSDGVKSFTGVKNIVFNGGAGNDELDVYDLSITGNVTANGGAGDDNLYVYSYGDDVFIGGSVSLTAEDTEVWAGSYGDDVTIVKNVTLNGGTTNGDYQGIYTYYGTDIFIGGSVAMNGGAGSGDYAEIYNYDTITDSYGYGNGPVALQGFNGYGYSISASSINIAGNVTINGGAGNDYGVIENYANAVYGEINIGGNVTFTGGDGIDSMGVRNFGYGSSVAIGASVVMNGGNGNDFMGIDNYSYGTSVTVGGNVTVHGNDGVDTLGLRNNGFGAGQLIDIAGKVAVHGDQGGDIIGALNPFGSTIEMGSLLVQGWDGDDTITAYGTTVLGKAEIWGGNGNDDFTFGHNFVGGGGSFINGWWGYDTLDAFGNTGATVTPYYIETIIT